jgi:ABC-type transport system substrate-binding protein
MLALLLGGCVGLPFGHGCSGPCPDTSQRLRYPLMTGAVINGISIPIPMLDPALAQDANSQLPIQLVFPGLVEVDAHMQIVDYTAARVDIDGAGTRYTFHLRPGLRWSDGTLLDANTFAFALNRAVDPCTVSLVAYSYLRAIKDAGAFNAEHCANSATDTIRGPIKSLIGDSITAVDARTLEIRLAQPARATSWQR